MPYRVENIVRKGEIVCFSFSHNFYSYIYLLRQNVALCGNGLKDISFIGRYSYALKTPLLSKKLRILMKNFSSGIFLFNCPSPIQMLVVCCPALSESASKNFSPYVTYFLYMGEILL